MRLVHRRLATAVAILATLVLLAACGGSKSLSKQKVSSDSSDKSAPTTKPEYAKTTSTLAAPTPGGVTLVAAPSKGVQPKYWGVQTQIAIAKDGDPVIVFSHEDVNNDDGKPNGSNSDDELLVTRYDHKTSKWSKPTSIAKGTFLVNQAAAFSLASDPQTGVVGLAVLVQTATGDGTGVDLYWSTDGGETWARSVVAQGVDTAQLPRIAIGGGKVAITYNDSENIHLATATYSGTSAPGSFQDEKAPGLESQTPNVNDWGAAVSLDSQGKPVVAYYVNPSGTSDEYLVAWDGSSGQPTKLLDSTVGQEHAYTALARRGNTVVIATSLVTSTKDDGEVVNTVRSTDGGASWEKPVGVPNDDASDPFDVSVALGGDSTAMVTYYPNGSGGGQKCAYPEAPWSSNLTSWNRCSLAEDETHPSMGTNFYPAVAASDDGTFWVVYSVDSPSDHVPAGVFVRRVKASDLGSTKHHATDTGSSSDSGNPLGS